MNKMKFQKEYIGIVYDLCKNSNATRKRIAKELKVNSGTVTNWKNKIPAFKDAIEKGKKEFWNF